MRPVAIEQARARFSLLEVAERTGICIPRSGGSVTVRCPFPSHGHYDSSPSLRLYLDDGIWHCFGCGCRGDVVEWVSQTEGVGWGEAIRILEQRAPLTNVWLAGREEHAPQQGAGRRCYSEQPDLSRTPPSRVFAALDAAWTHYSSEQLHYTGAQYLMGRGIDVGILEHHVGRYEVGHTAASSAGVVSVLRRQGFTADELVDAGLAIRSEEHSPLVDYYRERVLVPLRDEEGRVCALIGRNVGHPRWPKYKNPPRTCVYDKSVNLYQPLVVPSAPVGQVVVVEGTLDAMAIAVVAIRSGRSQEFCPVTQSGRELSPRQLASVAELARPIVLAFDGDAAGRDSAIRHARSALRLGLPTWVTRLPGDHDPASWLAHGGRDGLDVWSVNANRPPRPIPGGTFLAKEAGVRNVPPPGLETAVGLAL